MTREVREIATREQLAVALTALREQAGLTLRELARQLDVPLATLGDYFSGRHLPGPAQQGRFVALLGACGVVEEEELQAWIAALGRARRAAPSRGRGDLPPYLGLAAFDADDANRFFGREEVIAELLDLLAPLHADGGGCAVVVGASGSGKSSLLRAGVQASVREGRLARRLAERSAPAGAGNAAGADAGQSAVIEEEWSATVVTPGEDPLGALEGALAAGVRPLVLIVDQLEEIFAAQLSPSVRRPFFARLAAFRAQGGVILFGLRADFYTAASSEPMLRTALQHHQLLIGPMTREQLRRAVIEPARRSGVAVEEALVAALLADLESRVAEEQAHEPGVLPFLSHALLSTWQRSANGELTLAGYRAIGGLQGAIAKSAEDLYESLSTDEQELARRMFLRLVRVSEDAPTTRRRAQRDELTDAVGGGGPADSVLERFVAARLVTVEIETISISHEALLDAWPRLSGWLSEGREDLFVHRQLARGARAWEVSGRDDALLLRGSRLSVIVEWAADARHRALLNRQELDLVEASVALRQREEAALRRRTRRMRQLLATTAALAAVATGLAVFAFTARAAANHARDQALSRQLAIEAEQLEPTEPGLAMQLALAGYRISPTTEARSMLLDSTAQEMPTRLVGPTGPDFVAVGGNGSRLVVARSATDRLVLYALRAQRLERLSTSAPGRGGQLFAVAMSGDGRLVAAGGTAKVVEVDEVRRSGALRTAAVLRGFASSVYGVAFAPRAAALAAADADGTVRIWRRRTGGWSLAEVLHAPRGVALKTVAFSPNGRLIAAGGSGGMLLVWRGAGAPEQVPAGSATIETLSFDPSGAVLVSGGDDGALRRYHVAESGRITPMGRPIATFHGIVYSAAFAAHGALLAAGDAEGTVRIFSARSGALLGSIREPNPVSSLALEPTGDAIVTGDGAGVVRRWPLPLPTMVKAPGSVYFIEATRARPDVIAVVSGGSRGSVQFWRDASPFRPSLLATIHPGGVFGPVAGAAALSPNGQLLAVADTKAEIELYDVADLRRPRLLGPPLRGDAPLIEQLAFSPKGNQLAAADDGGAIHRWNVVDPAHPKRLPSLREGAMILGLAYSPDGRELAAASADGKVWLYRAATSTRPRLVGRLGGFSSYVYSVAFSPDGRWIAAGSADRTVRLFDVRDGGAPAASAVLSGPSAYVFQVAFSPTGRQLAAATTEGEVWLWNLDHGAATSVQATLRAASGSLFSVAFSPDGRSLFAGGTDRVIHRWIPSASAAARRVCSVAGTGILPAEWAEYAPGVAGRALCAGAATAG